MTSIHQELQKVGLSSISPAWLQACQSKFNTTDDILYQIINHDLRSVIRSSSSSTSNNSNAIELRNVIQNSLQKKATLPNSFQHLIQLEEILDVSLNAEMRLSLGPSSLSSPPVGNQQNRCLKLSFSDGYYSNGSTQDDSQEGQVMMTAMEISPIPNISVHSQPGIKCILSGPIDVRNGVLQLHTGNCTVIGGCIPDLIQVQKDAMDQAKRLKGVGIDPTYRALVYNPERDLDDENDEGEGESRDVVATVTPTPVPRVENQGAMSSSSTARASLLYQDHQNQVRPADRMDVDGEQQQHANVQQRAPRARSISPTPNVQQNMNGNRSTASSNRSASTNAANASMAMSNPYHRQQQSISRTSQTSTSSTSSANKNPYTSTSGVNTLSATSSNSHQQASVSNPYANRNMATSSSRPNSGASSTRETAIATSNTIVNNEPSPMEIDQEVVPGASNNNSTSRARSKSPQPPTSQLSTASSKSYKTPTRVQRTVPSKAIQQHLSPTALSESMSFGELKTLLSQLIADPILYQQYQEKLFLIPAKYASDGFKAGDFLGFDVKKVTPAERQLYQIKYGYHLKIRLMGSNASKGKVSVVLRNQVLRPYFPYDASTMRGLFKKDRKGANKVANDIGKSVIDGLKRLHSCTFKLLYSSDEFFGGGDKGKIQELDGKEPILELCKFEEM
ncbi:hypothetical protein CTEN210_12989 [Chaetoceros tenuissimus]|uniref:RecQ-mediated genome instability protein 1 n=1 Tax=Chaetoceros tenuissimus TaxID=426638 RepID=A0AAD3D2E2_9STRA|nr:hypothetical protein CTEN210_12989 [Chaetoceros tenuissimus]